MATKHIHKKKPYNKAHLKSKIDNLAKKVAQNGVFVVSKSEPGYKVLDCITNSLVIDNIPFKNVASELTDQLNKADNPKEISVNNLNNHITKYYKYMNDIIFYRHTISSSKDAYKVSGARARLLDAIHMAKEARHHINLI